MDLLLCIALFGTFSGSATAHGAEPNPDAPLGGFITFSMVISCPCTAVDSTFQVLLFSSDQDTFVQTAQSPELIVRRPEQRREYGEESTSKSRFGGCGPAQPAAGGGHVRSGECFVACRRARVFCSAIRKVAVAEARRALRSNLLQRTGLACRGTRARRGARRPLCTAHGPKHGLIPAHHRRSPTQIRLARSNISR